MNNSFIKKCGAAVCITGLCGALLLAPGAFAAQRPDTITVSQTAIEEENGFFSDLFGSLFGSSQKARIEADENGVYHYVVSDGKYQAFEPGVAQAGDEWFFVEDDGITIRTFAPGVTQVGGRPLICR